MENRFSIFPLQCDNLVGYNALLHQHRRVSIVLKAIDNKISFKLEYFEPRTMKGKFLCTHSGKKRQIFSKQNTNSKKHFHRQRYLCRDNSIAVELSKIQN